MRSNQIEKRVTYKCFLHEYRENRSREVDAQSQNILGILYTIILQDLVVIRLMVVLKNSVQNARYVRAILE